MSHIAKLCYELYKMEWLDKVPTKIKQDAYKDWYEEEYEPQVVDMFNSYNGETDTHYCGQSFEEWIFEHGYAGFGHYASYDEFLDNEFQDEERMNNLLNNAALYLEYLREVAAE